MSHAESVWVFNGARSTFPSGVFFSREAAEEWIRQHALTGTLTQYPLNVGMYEFAISAGRFSPKKPEQTTSDFIGRFRGADLITSITRAVFEAARGDVANAAFGFWPENGVTVEMDFL